MPKNKNKIKKIENLNKSIEKNLWKDFLAYFSKNNNKKIATDETEITSIGDYLDKYELKSRHSLGKNYLFGSVILKILEFVIRLALIIKKTLIWSFYRVGAMIMVAAIVFSTNSGVLSAPQAVTITKEADWEKGAFDNISTKSVNDSIQLKSAGTWNARTWAPTPDAISFGSSSAMANGYLYVTRGNADKSFYRYSSQDNTWISLADLPQAAHYGCDMIYDRVGSIYFIFGGYSKDFYKYNIEDGTWTKLPNLLDTVYTGASISFDGSDIFITKGQASTDFWKFDISENTWYNVAPPALTLSTGSDMVYGNNGYMYITRGSNTRTFYRYDVANNTWSNLANSLVNLNGEQKGVLYNGYIYFLTSGNSATFSRYNIASDSWNSLENSPQTNNYSALAFNDEDNLIYTIRANNTYDLWKFNPEAGATGSWVGPADLLATSGTGGGFNLEWNRWCG